MLSFLVGPEVKEKLKEAAWRQRKTVSAFVRDVVEEYLDEHTDLTIDKARERQFNDVNEERS